MLNAREYRLRAIARTPLQAWEKESFGRTAEQLGILGDLATGAGIGATLGGIIGVGLGLRRGGNFAGRQAWEAGAQIGGITGLLIGETIGGAFGNEVEPLVGITGEELIRRIQAKDPLASIAAVRDSNGNIIDIFVNHSDKYMDNPGYSDCYNAPPGKPGTPQNASKNLVKKAPFFFSYGPSPLILDLDGDGIETNGIKDSNIVFDHDGDGYQELTGWVANDDGILILDRNKNGILDNGNELFGDQTILANGQKAAQGYAALAELDSNADGKIDKNDNRWQELAIFKGDGTVLTMDQAGIQQLNLGFTQTNRTQTNGNVEGFTGSYVRTDGQTRAMNDYYFDVDKAVSIPTSFNAVSADVQALPDLDSNGILTSLRQAMTTSDALKALVIQFNNATDSITRFNLMDNILFAWAGSNAIPQGDLGVLLDPGRQTLLEKYYGTTITQNTGVQARAYNDAYGFLKEHLFTQLLAQTSLKPLLDKITLNITGTDIGNFTLAAMTSDLVTLASTNRALAFNQVLDFMRLMAATGNQERMTDWSAFYTSISNLGKDFKTLVDINLQSILFLTGSAGNDGNGQTWPGLTNLSNSEQLIYLAGAGNDVMYADYARPSLQDGGDGNDSLQGGNGNDLLIGGKGNDTVWNTAGDDLIVFNLSDGQDTVYTSGGSGVDRIIFGSGITSSMVTLSNTGFDDVTISITGGDSIVLQNQRNTSSGPIQYLEYVDGTIQQISTQLPGTETVTGSNGNDNLTPLNSRNNATLNALDGDDYLTGNQGADTLNGGNGLDWLDGGAGNDLLNGDAGDDRLYGNTGNDVLNGGAGNDTLNGDAGNDTLSGNTGNDSLYDSGGNDTYLFNLGDGQDGISDASGFDTLKLGAGITQSNVMFTQNVNALVLSINGTSDQVILWNQFDTQIMTGPNAGGVPVIYGIETIEFGDGSKLSRSQFEALATVQGTASADTLSGDQNVDKADVFYALAGNDIVYARGGDDTVYGGAGNDNLSGDAGKDRLYGEADLDTLFGGIGDDSLYGGDGNDYLDADGTLQLTDPIGNDLLDGGLGADSMIGGVGNDTYVVDNVGDAVTENVNEGIDTVQSSITYTLGNNVENLTLTGTANINGTGNSLNNVLTGNSGTNTLTGGAGDDTYVISTGDTVVEGTSAGIDTVVTDITYTLDNNVENLTLAGTANINGTGNALNNILIGNSGTNVLAGGAGNDTYYVSTGDTVTENTSAGTDTVYADITYTLGANLENLFLTGTANLNGTGNSSANTIYGNSGNNVLDGGTGADTYFGGNGDDTYVIDNAGDTITELVNAGTDTVQSNRTYTLGANLENLTLTGTTAINGTGNALNNILTGNSAVNTLTGGAGDDTYIIASNDVVVENPNEGIDTVQIGSTYTLGNNIENLTLTGTSNINGTGNALNNVLTGNSGINTLTGGAGDDTYVVSTGDTIVETANNGIDTVVTDITYSLSGTNLENLTLTGTANVNGTGNASNNILIGNSGINTLTGGAGNDTYTISTGDTVVENANEGVDTIITDINYYTLGTNIENGTINGTNNNELNGNSLNNVLTGNAGNNKLVGWDGNDTLDGKYGADQMLGGLGNDTYYVDNISDVIYESWQDSGIDQVFSSVSFTLPEFIENITLTGTANINATGNWSDSTMIGNSGNNILDAGIGLDTLIGGAGNDTYIVDDQYDVITENANEGTDTVISKGNTRTLGANQENLTLQGNLAVYADGNSLNNILTGTDLYNKLTGFDGNDYLDGKGGADDLVGGNGDDTYMVDNTGDVVWEAWNETGNDTVLASVDYTLTDYIENLTLTGNALNGTGNWGNNTLLGNTWNNTLIGGVGNDTLDGGSGSDTLQGGGDNDTYLVTRGGGYDVIGDSAGTSDKIKVSDNVDIALWFNGNDLQIGFKSVLDFTTVQSQQLAATQIERLERADGKFLTAADVNSVIAQINAYGVSNGITISNLNDVRNNDNLLQIVANAWHN